MATGCSLTGAHLDIAAKFQSLVILSAAKNLSTGCTLNFQTIARPFASLRVTDRMMAKYVPDKLIVHESNFA